MSNRTPPVRADTITEASAWFIEFRAGDVTPAGRARFERWLRRSPEHIQAYLEIAAGWSELPTADPEGRIDLQALLALARDSGGDNVVQLPRAVVRDRTASRRRRRFALAASLAALALFIGLLARALSRGGTYDTGVGEQRTLVLADGSTVVLNALTTIRVRMSRHEREIDLLRGQAFFHDTHEPDRPFIVRSGETAVRAVGTQFDVDRTPGRMVVTVLEGKVAVAQTAEGSPETERLASFLTDVHRDFQDLTPVLVTAGQQVTVIADNVRPPTRANLAAATAWLHERLVFDGTPLYKVAQQFNLHSSRHLVITDPELRNVGISGVYSSADPDSLIGFLRAQADLRVVETATEIQVSERRRK